MDYENLTLSDIRRLVEAIKKASADPNVIQAIIEREPAEPMENGRVTVGSMLKLLKQTNSCTVLPEEIVAMLNQPEPSSAQLIMTQQHAREIMGVNFFGIEEANKYFGVKPTMPQLAALANIPFSIEVIMGCKDTHILAAVFPLSILDIREKAPQDFYNQDWYDEEAFAADKGEIGWHLVRKTPVPDSTSKTWEQQQSLLGHDDETPTAQVLSYTIIGHFLATSRPAGQAGERLFENAYVRTSSVGSDGDHVYLGYFDSRGLHVLNSRGLHILNYFVGHRFVLLGVASERKSL